MRTLTIGTRGSALALWQAEHVAAGLRERWPGLEVELRVIKTRGDRIQDVPLAKVGGKGLFVKEIEQAMVRGEVDLAVHSIKDVPAELVPGLRLAAIPPRQDPRDALVSSAGALAELPPGARVGTSSLRRRCQLLARRPDLEVGSLRGNVDTRLGKLDRGEFDAILLAAAGLARLGLQQRVTELLEPGCMIPAVGQGALGIEIRADDHEVAERVAALHDDRTAVRVRAERALLGELGGGCQVPIAGHAVLIEDRIELTGLVGHPDGEPLFTHRAQGPLEQAEALGRGLARTLLEQGADGVLAEVYRDAGQS